MENQEIDVITFFYERGKSKADYIRKESAHIKIAKDVGLSNSREYFRKFFCRGNRELYFVKVF